MYNTRQVETCRCMVVMMPTHGCIAISKSYSIFDVKQGQHTQCPEYKWSVDYRIVATRTEIRKSFMLATVNCRIIATKTEIRESGYARNRGVQNCCYEDTDSWKQLCSQLWTAELLLRGKRFVKAGMLATVNRIVVIKDRDLWKLICSRTALYMPWAHCISIITCISLRHWMSRIHIVHFTCHKDFTFWDFRILFMS